ncbi:MAG TPA: hypothetical protein VGE26_09210 [Sphingobacteriaceae bacterium]
MSEVEQEQYALVYYLQNGNPGPVLRQIAEERIKWLEQRKYQVSEEPKQKFYLRRLYI